MYAICVNTQIKIAQFQIDSYYAHTVIYTQSTEKRENSLPLQINSKGVYLSLFV